MPCWEVRTIEIAFQAKHKDLLQKAIDRMGYTGNSVVQIEDDYLKFGYEQIPLDDTPINVDRRLSQTINTLKRSYSEVCIEEVAKKRKWALRKKNSQSMKLVRY